MFLLYVVVVLILPTALVVPVLVLIQTAVAKSLKAQFPLILNEAEELTSRQSKL